MTIKEKLKSYSDVTQSVRDYEQRIKEIREDMVSIKAIKYDGIQASSGNNDKIVDVIAELIDLESHYIQKIQKEIKLEREVNFLIDKLTTREQKLIRYRYAKNKTWEEICSLMGCSWQGAHKLHSSILKKMSKVD